MGVLTADEFVRQWTPYGMAVAIRLDLSLPGCDLDDLRQEVRIGVWNAYRNWNPDRGSSIQAFVALCVKRRLYTAIRIATAHRQRVLTDSVRVFTDEDGSILDVGDVIEDRNADPHEILDRRSDLATVARTLAGASPWERHVARLRLQGAGYDEIAAPIGVNVKSVDNALQRVRQQIRLRLAA